MANEKKPEAEVKVGSGAFIADKPGVVKVVYDLPVSAEYPQGKAINLTVITK